jgi:nitrate reductase beta subunit
VVDDFDAEVISIYLDDNDLAILDAARKHGVVDEDMRHALRHPIRVFRNNDLTMVIGPDRATRILEVGVVVKRGVEVVIHAMPARSKFLR